MAKRQIIKIDEEKCNGCGQCIKGCAEGALQLVDGKARLISELYCDGLGACLGECPTGAISIEEREAAPFDEAAVKERTKGPKLACGCPGSMEQTFTPAGQTFAPERKPSAPAGTVAEAPSALSHWPIQLHLINPLSGHFQGSDLLLAADCTAFSVGAFHSQYLANHKLAIACPKLDSNKESYIEKITQLIDEANINTLTVMMMEVPCCGGLLQLALEGAKRAKRKVPVKKVVVSLKGKILAQEWV